MAMGKARRNQSRGISLRKAFMSLTGGFAGCTDGVRERYLLAVEKFIDIHAAPRFLSVGAHCPTVTRMLEMTP
jgi:hypothetical protein